MNNHLFLFPNLHILEMFANFAELNAIATAIRSMVSLDDVNTVYSSILSQRQFHSDYSLRQIYYIVVNARYYDFKASRICYLALEAKLATAFPFYKKFLEEIYFHESCEVIHMSADDTKVYKDVNGEVLIPKFGDEVIIRKDGIQVAKFSFVGPQPEDNPFSVLLDYPLIKTCNVRNNVVQIEFHNLDYIIGYKEDADINENDFANVIRNDDVEAFSDMYYSYEARSTKLPTFSTGLGVITIIEFMALCGAIKCFKFMFNNNQYSETESLQKAIIYGRNVEIMRLVNFSDWQNLEDLFKVVITTYDADLIDFWFNSVELPKVLADKYHFVQNCVNWWNLSVLQRLYDMKFFTFSDPCYKPSYINDILQIYIHFGGVVSFEYLQHISADLYPLVLPTLDINSSANFKENTLIQAIRARLSFNDSQITAIKHFMYPSGVPQALKMIYVAHIRKVQFIRRKDKITLNMFTYMDITPADTTTLFMFSKNHSYRLLDYIISHPASCVELDVYRFLFTSGIKIPKVSGYILFHKGSSAEKNRLFREFKFYY